MNVLIAGAGGFIGGHFSKHFCSKKNINLTCVDIKKKKHWYQKFTNSKNIVSDLSIYKNCIKALKKIDYVFNFACNMGGVTFIENNKAECMLSVLINTNLLKAAKELGIKKYFFSSSSCVYAANKQKNLNDPFLKEEDAYPADPENGYGWEKLFSERMCNHFYEDFGMEVRIARFHNIYGPYGAWKGGREKAPAAFARKFVEAQFLNKNNEIEISGDGSQIRSFTYIDDCLEGSIKLFNSKYSKPMNIGSSDFLSINQLIKIFEEITSFKIKKKYIKNAPLGVMYRSSDNTLTKKILKWEPSINLKAGLEKTYKWVLGEFKKKYKI
jgi:nucleoside-diphosphate-sugar epimerase